MDPSVTKGCQKRAQNRSKTDFFSALWGAGRTCTKHHYLLCISHIGAYPECSIFRLLPSRGRSKKKVPKRHKNAATSAQKPRHVSKLVSKMNPKIDPTSIKNRGSEPVPAPRVPKCRVWGAGIDFLVLGLTFGTPNRRKIIKMGWHMDAIGIGKKC